MIVQRLARTMTADAIAGWLNAAVRYSTDSHRSSRAGGYERVARVAASFKSRVCA